MIRSERLLQTFCTMVGIDAPSFGERAMADHLSGCLRRLGLQAEEDDAGCKIGGTAGNLFAVLPGTAPGAPLLFCGHMDTVQPALGKRARVGEDGTVTSDGTTVLGADDAAGLAVIMEALTSVLEDGAPHPRLEILFSVAEEPYDRGSEQFDFTRPQAKEAYVLDLDGPVGRAVCAAPSICAFSAVFTGIAAHAGFAPEEGRHAIAAAAQAVAAMRMGRLDTDTTLNIGQITGGEAANIVPARCEVKGEIRSRADAAAERALANLRAGFARAAGAHGVACEVTHRFGCRAFSLAQKHPLIRRYAAACAAAGVPMRLDTSFGGSDANQLNTHGIAALVVANAMFRPHTCGEYTRVEELARAARVTQALMTAWM